MSSGGVGIVGIKWWLSMPVVVDGEEIDLKKLEDLLDQWEAYMCCGDWRNARQLEPKLKKIHEQLFPGRGVLRDTVSGGLDR
jgi:hypothetical protein